MGTLLLACQWRKMEESSPKGVACRTIPKDVSQEARERVPEDRAPVCANDWSRPRSEIGGIDALLGSRLQAVLSGSKAKGCIAPTRGRFIRKW